MMAATNTLYPPSKLEGVFNFMQKNWTRVFLKGFWYLVYTLRSSMLLFISLAAFKAGYLWIALCFLYFAFVDMFNKVFI